MCYLKIKITQFLLDSILRLLGMSLTASCQVIVWLKNGLPLAQITLKEKAGGNFVEVVDLKSRLD